MDTRSKHQRDRGVYRDKIDKDKPSNNRVMCPHCGRMKQLFESESSANNFIKFNAKDIPNGEMLRSYWCDACAGWHVTSHNYKKCYEGRTDRLIERAKRDSGNHCNLFDVANARQLFDSVPKEFKEGKLKKFKKYVKDHFQMDTESDVYKHGLERLFFEYHAVTVRKLNND